MAEKKKTEAKAEEPEAEAAPKPKKKGKLLVILIALLLLGGGVGGAAWWFMKAKKPSDPKAATQKKEEQDIAPIFIRLDTFTVNLQKTETESHFLQVEMQFKVADPKVGESVKLRMPEIRNALLLLLSSKTQEELGTVEGKQKLSADIVTQSNQIIRAKEPAKDGVVGVYFTSFVIQ